MRAVNYRAVAVSHLGLATFNMLRHDQLVAVAGQLKWATKGSEMHRLDGLGYDFHGAGDVWTYSIGTRIYRGFASLPEALESAFTLAHDVPPPTYTLLKSETVPVIGGTGFTYRMEIEVGGPRAYSSRGEASVQAEMAFKRLNKPGGKG